MAASKEKIQEWFEEGVERGATHMIVACDTYDYDDYPVYVMPGQEARTRASEVAKEPMARVMEVYNLRGDKAEQLAALRCFNYD